MLSAPGRAAPALSVGCNAIRAREAGNASRRKRAKNGAARGLGQVRGNRGGRHRLVLSYSERAGCRRLTKELVRDSRRTSLYRGGVGGLHFPSSRHIPSRGYGEIASRLAFLAALAGARNDFVRLLPLAHASVAMTATACARPSRNAKALAARAFRKSEGRGDAKGRATESGLR